MTLGFQFPTLLNSLKQIRLLTTLLQGKSGWLAVLVWLAIAAPAAALELRVAIKDGVSQVKVGSSTKAVVRDSSGRVLGELAPMNSFDATPKAGNISLHNQWRSQQLWIEPQQDGFVWIGDRWYRGRVLLMPNAKGLSAINYVDLEHYLYSVLGGEMHGSWPQEALKAQAVAARSYVLHQRQKARSRHFDVGNTTAWQVYYGVEKESAGTLTAVDATAGQVLTHNGQIIEAVFHSSSGGHTENVENVWSQPLPYLRGVPDYDQGAPVYQWAQTFSSADLRNRISGVGNILSMTPQRTTPHGRIVTMKVVGDRGTRTMSGSELRSALNLRSTLFSVIPQGVTTGTKGNTGGAPSAFQIQGRGFGHGLGMSQWGAYNMANQGFNYQQIVLHYYRGTTLSRAQAQ